MSLASEDIIINALNHKIRREILRILNENSMSYTQLLEHFDISTGKLNYHIKLLSGFIDKDENNMYNNTTLGERMLTLLKDFRNSIKEEEPLIKKAFVSQMGQEKSFLYSQLFGGLFLRILLLSIVLIMVLSNAILLTVIGFPILFIWPFYLIAAIIGVISVIWILNQNRKAKRFIKSVDNT